MTALAGIIHTMPLGEGFFLKFCGSNFWREGKDRACSMTKDERRVLCGYVFMYCSMFIVIVLELKLITVIITDYNYTFIIVRILQNQLDFL